MESKLFSCEYFNKFVINVCPYTITGEKSWVMEKAKEHLVNKHGCEEDEDLMDEISESLIDD